MPLQVLKPKAAAFFNYIHREFHGTEYKDEDEEHR